MADKTLFETLNGINVNDKTEKKGGLTYLSWAWAWAEVKKRCSDATYEILRDANGLPYFKDDGVGYMCMTTVTINGETLMMWLPVMDYKNRAMLQPTMFDINKTIMRCLTKNLAMFGLGLYIYSGEDLPDEQRDVENEKMRMEADKLIADEDEKKAEIKQIIEEVNGDTKKLLEGLSAKFERQIDSIDELRGKEVDATLKLVKKKENNND